MRNLTIKDGETHKPAYKTSSFTSLVYVLVNFRWVEYFLYTQMMYMLVDICQFQHGIVLSDPTGSKHSLWYHGALKIVSWICLRWLLLATMVNHHLGNINIIAYFFQPTQSSKSMKVFVQWYWCMRTLEKHLKNPQNRSYECLSWILKTPTNIL